MERSLWTAATGMAAQQVNMDTIANNLANLSTNAFKRSRPVFVDLLYQTLNAPGTASSSSTNLPSGVQLGLGARTSSVQKMFEQGEFKPTENPLDVIIAGRGFYKFTQPDGTEVYSRDGAFTLDENGNIVNSMGYPLNPPMVIPQDANSITIAPDGTVSVQLSDNTVTQLGNIEVANFINPGGLQALGDNLFVNTVASGDAISGTPGQDGLGELRQGFLETSNVNIVGELVDMITAQRAYELNSRSIRSVDDMLRLLGQLVR